MPNQGSIPLLLLDPRGQPRCQKREKRVWHLSVEQLFSYGRGGTRLYFGRIPSPMLMEGTHTEACRHYPTQWKAAGAERSQGEEAGGKAYMY